MPRQPPQEKPTVQANRDGYLVKSLVHASEILWAFHHPGEGLRLRDVMDRTGFGKGMCFRLLYTLRHLGFIAKTDGNRYRLTSEIRRRKQYRIGYASQGQDSSFVHEVHRGLLKAAERERVELIVVDNRYQPKVAVKNAELLIRDGVDHSDRVPDRRVGGAGDCGEYHEAKIPLVAIDIPHPGATYFGANNYEAGLLAGRYLGKYARQCWNGHADEILLVSLARAGALPAARTRGAVAGIREVIHEAANWSVVSRRRWPFKTASSGFGGTCERPTPSASWSRRPTTRARSAPRVPSKRPGVRRTAPSRGRTPNRMHVPSCAVSRRR